MILHFFDPSLFPNTWSLAPHGSHLLGAPNPSYFAYYDTIFGQFISPCTQGYKIPKIILDLPIDVIVFLVAQGLCGWTIVKTNNTQVCLCFLGE